MFSRSARVLGDVNRAQTQPKIAESHLHLQISRGPQTSREPQRHHHPHSDLLRADPALIYTRTARGHSLRVDTKPQSWVGRPPPPTNRPCRLRRLFCPALHGVKLLDPWLTNCAAPKNKKVEKMSLGDFLGDQCRRPPPCRWMRRPLTRV